MEKLRIEEVKKSFEDKGYKLLTKEYENCSQILEFEKDGYIYVGTRNGFIKTNNPKKWSNKNPHSINNLNLFLKRSGYTCEIISKEYFYGKLKIKCECGCIYEASIGNMLKGVSVKCRECSFLKRGESFIISKRIDIFKEYGLKLIEPYTKTYDYLYFIDKDGYYARCSAKNLKSSNGKYLIFTIKNKYLLENICRYIEINNLKCKLISTQIKSTKDDLLEFKCECGDSFYMSLNRFLSSNKDKCNKCADRIGADKRIENSSIEFENLIKENKLNPIENYKGRNERIYFINEDGYYVYLSVASIQNNKTITNTIFHKVNKYIIENIKTYIKNNNLTCVLLSNKYKNNASKLKFRCECGDIYYCTFAYFKTLDFGKCKKCREKIRSVGEKKVKEWMEYNNIEAICEFTFDDCKDKYLLPFDFYIPLKSICIEVQGIQHYKPIDFFGGIKNYEYTVKHDKIKRDYCIKNNIIYLEIKYSDFKKNEYIKILEKHINKLH